MNNSLPLHGGQLRQIAERFGVPVSELLDFSANINPEGPPEAVHSCLRASLNNAATLTQYPDLSERELRESLAHYAGVRAENVAVSNGFVPLLETALRTLSIRSCVVPVPAFVEYRRTLERLGVEVIPRNLTSGSTFSYSDADLLDGAHDAILLANPQNPSGVLCSRDTLLRIVSEAAGQKMYVLLDEAFIDYCSDGSLAREVEQLPNLIVFRSVTKFFGIAGMRVAYVLANATTSKELQESTAPWSITTLASLAARVAVQDDTYASRAITENNARRDRLKIAIEGLGLHVYPSAANFLLFRLSDSLAREDFWERLIREHHVVLRHCGNYEGLRGGHLRAAVRTDYENVQLVEALSQIVGAHGIGGSE
jgi:threonine-phosphate decarboxylase